MLSQLCTAHLPSEWKPLNTLENDVPHKAEGILEVSEDSLNASFRRERRSNGRGERGKEKLPARTPYAWQAAQGLGSEAHNAPATCAVFAIQVVAARV